jgi:hypothetical protein
MVDWSKVSHCSFLEEFDFLLHDPRGQINTKPWAQPVMRAVMKQARRVAQARTEIVRCNVETRRLRTAIVDKEQLFVKVLDGLKASGQTIYHAVHRYCTLRRRVNSQLLVRIAQIHALNGFTGIPYPSIRKGTIPIDPPAIPETEGGDSIDVAGNDGDVEDLSDDDDLAGEVERIMDYMSSI